jgi:hypothetical protein
MGIVLDQGGDTTSHVQFDWLAGSYNSWCQATVHSWNGNQIAWTNTLYVPNNNANALFTGWNHWAVPEGYFLSATMGFQPAAFFSGIEFQNY